MHANDPRMITPLPNQPTVAKAVVAVTGALVTGITTALADGTVTIWEIIISVLVAAGSGAAVWATTNERR